MVMVPQDIKINDFLLYSHIIVGQNVQQWTCNNVGGLIYNPYVNQMD
jgi:hypothetical protein